MLCDPSCPDHFIEGMYIYHATLGGLSRKEDTIVLQWLEYFSNHENMFETGIVRANEC